MAVLSLSDAKIHLNLTNDDHNVELLDVIDAAVARLALDCGPLEAVATTCRVDGGTDALTLPVLPAVSLTSVTPVGGTALTLGDLYLDTAAGLVTYNFGGTFSSAKYTVVYQAGRASVDADLLMGVKELVRFAWGPQRGGSRRPGSPPSDGAANTIPGVGEELPFNVQKWIANHQQPGFA